MSEQIGLEVLFGTPKPVEEPVGETVYGFGSLPEGDEDIPVLTEVQVKEAAAERQETQDASVYVMTEDRKLETNYYVTQDLPEVQETQEYTGFL